jgi:carbamoyl-phosphate synthase small subunit
MKGRSALLVLADGTVFHGKSTGLDGTAWGEICFNTGMTGYQEIFTDPSYLGQLMVTATSHIGNYGVHNDEGESSRVQISGLICKSFSSVQTRPGKTRTLAELFAEQGKVAISDVDTRALVRHIRQAGTMNAIVSTESEDVSELLARLEQVPSMDGLELLPQVSTSEVRRAHVEGSAYRVAALDFGIKENIIRRLNAEGISVDLYPYNTPYSVLASDSPDGFFLSNGPGDPAASPQVVETVRESVESGKPVFGICLGHQMIALTGKGEITSQNHGFAVSMEDVVDHPLVELTHVHLNDGTVAGIRRTDKPVFSVQYHPEAAPGPHDSRYLFTQFASLMNQQH